ncbi:hypothetical protein [Roseixanthobacter pseudopolyaromaticivorans]|uniref:hypothetical protein n=1 Tax=Xanthobacteraceae TaxID=335928 RepID=UPI0037266F26
MAEILIRILFRDETGKIEDGVHDCDLSNFAGFLPNIGDTIVDPSVLQGLDRSAPENREVWRVVDRIFNPKDQENYVALVVEARPGTMADEAFL